LFGAIVPFVQNDNEATVVADHHRPWVNVKVVNHPIEIVVSRDVELKLDLGLIITRGKHPLLVVTVRVKGDQVVALVVLSVIHWIMLQDKRQQSGVAEFDNTLL